MTISYCQYSGTRLTNRSFRGKNHLYCSTCSKFSFLGPKLAVAVVVSIKGHLLLERRGIEPGLGHWSFPSGYVDQGELPEAAAIREVYEETDVTIVIDGLLGVYAEKLMPVVLIAYYGHLISGTPIAKDEVQEIGLFKFHDLPTLTALPHDSKILQVYQMAVLDKASDPSVLGSS